MTGYVRFLATVLLTLCLLYHPTGSFSPKYLHARAKLRATSASDSDRHPSVKHSRTSRESAVSVEWERRTELERRLEDGVNYEHISEEATTPRKRTNVTEDTFPKAYGVFCGYQTTSEDYIRLRSADP